MQSDLEALQIKAHELETWVDLDSVTALAIDAYRGLILKNSKQMLSVALTEALLFIVLLSFIMPVSLIMPRNAGSLPNHPSGITRLFTLILGISLLGIFMLNIYLWQQVKQVKSLAKLMDKVDKYNGVIHSLSLIDELESLGQSSSQSPNRRIRKEAIQTLSLTKETLSNALQVEKLIRKHHRSLSSHHELCTNLEKNLATLMSLNLSDRTNEYSQLFNESLQIGLSVHQELKKLSNLN